MSSPNLAPKLVPVGRLTLRYTVAPHPHAKR